MQIAQVVNVTTTSILLQWAVDMPGSAVNISLDSNHASPVSIETVENAILYHKIETLQPGTTYQVLMEPYRDSALGDTKQLYTTTALGEIRFAAIRSFVTWINATVEIQGNFDNITVILQTSFSNSIRRFSQQETKFCFADLTAGEKYILSLLVQAGLHSNRVERLVATKSEQPKLIEQVTGNTGSVTFLFLNEGKGYTFTYTVYNQSQNAILSEVLPFQKYISKTFAPNYRGMVVEAQIMSNFSSDIAKFTIGTANIESASFNQTGIYLQVQYETNSDAYDGVFFKIDPDPGISFIFIPGKICFSKMCLQANTNYGLFCFNNGLHRPLKSLIAIIFKLLYIFKRRK